MWHVIKFLLLCNGEMSAVILKIYYMPNGLTSILLSKIPPNFQGCWGEGMKK